MRCVRLKVRSDWVFDWIWLQAACASCQLSPLLVLEMTLHVKVILVLVVALWMSLGPSRSTLGELDSLLMLFDCCRDN